MNIKVYKDEGNKVDEKKNFKDVKSKLFNEVFVNKMNEMRNIEKERTKKRIKESEDVKYMEKILKINIIDNEEKFTKDNGKLNIVNILDQYAGKLNTRELNKFITTLNSLYKDKLIDEKDYFEGLRWLRTKIEKESIIINIKKEILEINESL